MPCFRQLQVWRSRRQDAKWNPIACHTAQKKTENTVRTPIPQQLCVMLGAFQQLQCLTEETLFRPYENLTYLQLKIPKYQQTLLHTEEDILCTYKKRFHNKTWKQTVCREGDYSYKLYINFTHRNVFSYLTSTAWLSKTKLQASMT